MSAPRTPNPLLQRLGVALEVALNRALALDAETQARLTALEGRRIGVDLRGTGLALAVSVAEGRLKVGPHWEKAGDLNLRAAPASLIAFALRRGFDGEGIGIEGEPAMRIHTLDPGTGEPARRGGGCRRRIR